MRTLKALTKLLVVPLVFVLSLVSTTAPTHADIYTGTFTCFDGAQAKLEVHAAGVVTVLINGRYFTTGPLSASAGLRTVYVASGATDIRYAVLSWSIGLVVPYCWPFGW